MYRYFLHGAHVFDEVTHDFARVALFLVIRVNGYGHNNNVFSFRVMPDKLFKRLIGELNFVACAAIDKANNLFFKLNDDKALWIACDALTNLVFTRGLVASVRALLDFKAARQVMRLNLSYCRFRHCSSTNPL